MKSNCEQNGFNPAEMMKKFMGGMGEGEGKCNPAEMMKKFMGGQTEEGGEQMNPADMMKKFMGGKCGECKNKRAQAVNKNHENVMRILPGQTQFAEIEVQNGTQWPWKQGCFFGMDDSKHGDEETSMPIEPIRVDIPFNVAGN